jgi:hypothetical protein
MSRTRKKTSIGAFATEDGQPHVQEAVIAYFDILGFTQDMQAAAKKGQSDDFLKRFSSVAKGWYLAARDNFSAEWGDGRRLWELNSFSDNVVIGHPIRHGGEVELGHVMSDIAMLQMGFILEGGFFLRGAVAAGDLYMDDDVIYGTGLLSAVDAEHEADVPRVVIHASAARLVREQLRFYASIRNAPHTRILLRDEDGHLFVNYLSAAFEYATGAVEDWLKQHREIVVGRLERYRSKPRIWAKYAWVARYHNYFCTSFAGVEGLTIDVTLLSLGASRLDQVYRNHRRRQSSTRR